MVRTPSTMLPLGTLAPNFELPNVDGQVVCLKDFSDQQPLLVMFMCNHCPYVVHLADALADFAKEYQAKGLSIVGISSNDATAHPDDSPELMVKEAAERGYVFPYLYDESQEVAKAYQAACTPDFFLFDRQKQLVYRGQFDSSRPGSGDPTGEDMRTACDAVLAGNAPAADQTASLGCNIKWKPGQEPAYFG